MTNRLPNTPEEQDAILKRVVVCQEQFDKAWSIDNVDLKCDHCSTGYQRKKHQVIRKAREGYYLFCSKRCSYAGVGKVAAQRTAKRQAELKAFTPPTKPAEPQEAVWDCHHDEKNVKEVKGFVPWPPKEQTKGVFCDKMHHMEDISSIELNGKCTHLQPSPKKEEPIVKSPLVIHTDSFKITIDGDVIMVEKR